MSFYIQTRLRPGEKILFQPQFSRLPVNLSAIMAIIIVPGLAYFLMQLLGAAGVINGKLIKTSPGAFDSAIIGFSVFLVSLYFFHKYVFDYFNAGIAITDQRIIGRIPRLLLAFSLHPVDLPLANIQKVSHVSYSRGPMSCPGLSCQFSVVIKIINALAYFGTVVVVDLAGRKIKIRAVAAPAEWERQISQAAGLAAAAAPATDAPAPPGPAPEASPAPAAEPAPGPVPAGAPAPGVAEQAMTRRADWKPLAVLAAVLVVVAGLALWWYLPGEKSGQETAKAPAPKTTTSKAPAPQPAAPKAAASAPDQPRTPAAAKAPSAAKAPTTADDYLQQGIKEKDPQKKIDLFTKAIALAPNYALAFSIRGYAYYSRKDYDQALQDFDKALSLKPNDVQSYNGRGNVHYDRKAYDLALADYSKAIELKPTYSAAYNNRGNVYFKKRDFDQALNDYNQALKLNPKYALAYANRGNIFFEKKEYGLALKDYDQAVNNDPQYAWAYYRRAVIHHQKGDSEQARRDYTKAKSLNPKLPDLAIK